MHLRGKLHKVALGTLLATVCAAAVDAQEPGLQSFQQNIRATLERYCLRCHGEQEPEGGVALAGFRSPDDVWNGRETWHKVWDVLRTQRMPPEGATPTPSERRRMRGEIAAILGRLDPGGRPDPGHVVLRRLNQVEYNNTVLDLFRTYRSMQYYNPERGMPEEVRVVLHREYRQTVVTLPPDDVGYGFTNIGEVLSLPPFLMEKYMAASRQVIEQLSEDGRFRERKRRGGQQPAAGGRSKGRKLPGAAGASPREFIADFGGRAFRRPLTDAETNRYVALYESAAQRGAEFDEAILVPIQAMLVSPNFLFKVEGGVAAEEQDSVRPLDDYELAVRLSYFLWSTMPDDELFRLAGEGKLRDPDALEQQARRMLRHRFSKELGQQFGMQWLQVTGVRAAMPFPDLYPDFYRLKYLPEALQLEALLLFETIVVEDRSVLDFVDPGFTWLNGTLNGFYGIDAERSRVRNSGLFWHRYALPDKQRGGVLTMGAPLLATSLATRTSPVKRGKWILETLLAAPPPPPPNNVPDLEKTPAAEGHVSLRQRLELHRADPACASCHRRMDAMGFALEHFDAIGAWRDDDGGEPIDAKGSLGNDEGARFDGAAELKQLLVTRHRDDFLYCLAEKMLTYALGRKLEMADDIAVAGIVERLKANDTRFSALVAGIVRSEPFRFARVSPNAAATKTEVETEGGSP